MAKGVEYFIAERTSQGEKHGGGGVMMPVAKVAVALSIAVMVITLAVIIGFKREIETKFTALSGQLLVTSIGGATSAVARPIESSEELEQLIDEAAVESGVEVERISPYVSRGVILRTSEVVEGVVLKGVDGRFDRALFEAGLTDGVVPPFGESESGRNALISKLLADELRLKVGDRLELLTTDSREESGEESMRRDLYRVGGIYTQGLGEGERRFVITDMRNVQRLNSFEANQITGYEVWCSSMKRAVEFADRTNELLIEAPHEVGLGVGAYAVQSLYPSVFDWLAAHDVNAMVVIIIMMVVAIFNITTAMLILVLERTQLIGTLKVLGMSNGSIRRIFLYRALSIASWGMLWGNGVAIALCLLQQRFKLLKLDEQGYMLSSVPISLGADWIVMLNLGVALVIVMLVIVPTRLVSRIEPSEAIKFE